MTSRNAGAMTLAVLAASLVHAQEQERKPEEQEEERPSYQEVVVVSVSRLQEQLVNAPASVSVVPSEVIESSPAQNYGDLLRTVPGLNVIQLSARDINVASRSQTGTIVTSQLALVDGRTVYQDFLGFVMWDLIPIQAAEIDQIEVIRGPVSAVWGANAMTGVVNIITKAPRDMQGTTLTVGYGGFDRAVEGREEDSGAFLSLGATHAHAVNERLAYKLSAGVLTQDPFPRPAGLVPNPTQTPYPPFANPGSTQPKFDFRLDYDIPAPSQDPTLVRKWVVGAGLARSQGIIHTGIGPFEVDPDTSLGYGRLSYRHGSLELKFFTNAISGEEPALLTRGSDGEPIVFRLQNRTYDVEMTDFRALGNAHLISYGGNFRRNDFDLSLAPEGDSRNEGGFYIQDEIFLSTHLRWIVGGRVDRFDLLDDVVFSPRTALLLKPTQDHTFRVSFNRAFRAPAFVNNFLDIQVLSDIDLGGGTPFVFPVNARGSTDLKEESLTAYEIGYTGVIGRGLVLNAAFFLNDTRNIILFTQTGSYDSQNPPPRWPLPPGVLDRLVAQGMGLPSELAYRNFDRVRNRGVELSLDARLDAHFGAFANYSWQDEPEPFGFDISELNLPSSYLANVGFDLSGGRYFGNLSASFVGEAFWQDVLDSRFHGPTDAYTLVNGTFGIHWEDGKLTTAVKVTNLLNDEIQQHVFGDVIKRQIVGELRFRF